MFVDQSNGRDWLQLRLGEQAGIALLASGEQAQGRMIGDDLFRTERELVITVPASWSDFEVAIFVVEILQGKADLPGWFDFLDNDIRRAQTLFFNYVLKPGDFTSIRKYNELYGENALKGLKESAEFIGEITELALNFVPGTDPILAMHEFAKGRPVAATISILSIGGAGLAAKLLARGAKGVVFKFGSEATQFLMPSAFLRFTRLPAADVRSLNKALEAATDAATEARIFKTFIKSQGLDQLVKDPALARRLLSKLMKEAPRNGIPAKIRVAAHHIVPVELFNDPQIGTLLHRIGVDLNGLDNGVLLPVRHYANRRVALHTGSHLARYRELVRRRIVEGQLHRLNPKAARLRALEIIDGIRNDLLHRRTILQSDDSILP
jgi:hypothetical protein